MRLNFKFKVCQLLKKVMISEPLYSEAVVHDRQSSFCRPNAFSVGAGRFRSNWVTRTLLNCYQLDNSTICLCFFVIMLFSLYLVSIVALHLNLGKPRFRRLCARHKPVIHRLFLPVPVGLETCQIYLSNTRDHPWPKLGHSPGSARIISY